MRVSAGWVFSIVLLAVGILTTDGCRHAGLPLVAKSNEPGIPYDNSKLSCKSQGGKKVCEIKIADILPGEPCTFDSAHRVNEPPHTHPHDKFAIYINDGYALKIIGDGASHKTVRIRDFIFLPNSVHRSEHDCPRPFATGVVTNNFGEDETGSPVKLPNGCVYELAVQSYEIGTDDEHHPEDPNELEDPGNPLSRKKRYFCVDPHFEMINARNLNPY